MHFNARVVFIDVLIEVGFDDAVVVDAESLTEGILRDFEDRKSTRLNSSHRL